MRFFFSAVFVIAQSLFQLTFAQYFPPEPEGITVVKSKLTPGVSISYKRTHICETTSNVKSYSGYIHLPPNILNSSVQYPASYHINTFFWFFEARHDPANAPLAIYLAGGPGDSSIFAAASGENGPCIVGPDSNSTTLNPWSFNNRVNMLYIDQPDQVGFSYDTLVNGTLDLISGVVTPANFSSSSEEDGPSIISNLTTTLAGTFPSQDPSHTANNTEFCAKALWHFAQAWFAEFPKYKPGPGTRGRGRARGRRRNDCGDKEEATSISIFGNSYAGFYIPATFAYFERQNARIKAGELTGAKHIYLPLDTVGITNGCIDLRYQVRSYPEIAYNNTYGEQWIPEDAYRGALDALSMPGGCYDAIDLCRELGRSSDQDYRSHNDTVNQICFQASAFCALNALNVYGNYSGRSNFDMANFLPQIHVPPGYYAAAFFNQPWVQMDLGVPVNFTKSSAVVQHQQQIVTGDTFRREGIKDLEFLLGRGVKLALIYGDRDYQCNWLGGENISLNIDYLDATNFRSSGYAKIVTNETYTGGLVRQYGNVSFSRVFDAGHAVSAHQPETVLRIFERSIFNADVATGLHDLDDLDFGSGSDSDSDWPDPGSNATYRTDGPVSSFGSKNSLPDPAPIVCHLYGVAYSCTSEQIQALQAGVAVVRDWIVVNDGSAGGEAGD